MGQHFMAVEPFAFPNGATGYRPGGPFDCLGPYAKVVNCPVEGLSRRYTCYASGYADTMFSIPANTRIRRMHVKGYFSLDNGMIQFIPYSSEASKINYAFTCERRELEEERRKLAKDLKAWTGGSSPLPLSKVTKKERGLISNLFREQLIDWSRYWRGGVIRSSADQTPSVLSVARIFWKRARYDAHATFR